MPRRLKFRFLIAVVFIIYHAIYFCAPYYVTLLSDSSLDASNNGDQMPTSI